MRAGVPRRRGARRHDRASLDLDHVSAGYGPFRALFDVSLTVEPGRGGRAPRAERRREDDRRPGGHRARRTRPTGSVVVEGDDMTGAPVAPVPPGRDHPRPRGPLRVRHPHGRGEPRAVVPGVARSHARWPAALERAFDAVPGARQPAQAGGRHAVGRRAADARDGPGAGRGARSCSSPTSCRSAWRRSSSTRSTPSLDRLRAAGTALLIVEQHVGHALDAVRPGGAARPRRHRLGGPGGRGRRPRGDGGVRDGVISARRRRAAAMAASARSRWRACRSWPASPSRGSARGCFTT